MKRKRTNTKDDIENISSRTRSKRQINNKLNKTYTEWISATKVRNYMLNDSLVDWLEEHHSKKSSSSFTIPINCVRKENKNSQFNFSKFIMEKGIDFETSLIKYINTLDIPVNTVSNTITDESVQETINLMKNGAFIIHSAPVRNYTNNTHGIIDLLVRSDYLHKLVDECPLTKDEIKTASYWSSNDKNYYSRPYHYIVIDIKFSTLPLRANGKHLLNSGSYPAYKAQCLIYTDAIGLIQGYTSRYAFILGRRWKYTQKLIKYNNYTCLNKIGVIDYKTVDKSYIKRTKDALVWNINNKKNGSKWSVSPPSRIELYPNMSIDSGKWQKEKEKISSDIGEISNIWYCGWQNRNIGIRKGIKSWRDPKCTSENIGIKGVRASIIDSILDINRQNIDKIRPKKIKNNLFKWKSTQNEMFVDFETLSDIFSSLTDLPNQKQTDMIFMIGVYWKTHSSLEYKSFIAKQATHEEEYRIMNEFNTFVKKQGNPKLWYWYADNLFWLKSERKLYDMAFSLKEKHKIKNISNNWNIKEWADMGQIFKHEPIVVKGCFKFGLKAIANAMKDNGLINTIMDSNCNSGMNAMIAAYKFYSENDLENPLESDIMKDIEKYNKFDCQVLYDILTYLRKNHI
jgi:hypothetical protein